MILEGMETVLIQEVQPSFGNNLASWNLFSTHNLLMD